MASAITATRVLPSIPLRCNICPKKPDFSDTSHLLTHIASKGHLSTYYKVKVRSANEAAARRLIDDYDSWYAGWNIEGLMSVRMSLKEQKKMPRSRLSSVNAAAAAYDSPAAYLGPSTRSQAPDPVDPRLAGHFIKPEPASRSATPFDPYPLRSIYAPLLPPWPASPYITVPFLYQADEGDYFAEEREPSSEPSTTQRKKTRRRHKDSLSNLIADNDDIDEALSNDANKLKGILWPGMNMFDSATPQMKRTRNQKKANSVVEQLEYLSQGIEATELVFSPSGTLQKSRTITGYPNSSSSPVKGEEIPLKRPRQPSRRLPLAGKDLNTGRRRARKPKKEDQQSQQDQHLPFYGGSRPLYDEVGEQEVVNPDSKRQKPQRKERALSVFNDADHGQENLDDPIDHDMGFLSAFSQAVHHTEPDRYVAPMQFRPADYSHYYHESYNNSYHAPTFYAAPNPFFEPPMQPAWDVHGVDRNGHLVNQLFDASFPEDGAGDDERTISALASDA